ncbi:putative bifunctional diguanylate cyclase/phosphodiesterase [Thiocystis violacea]|uniref:putative bifunctional diguanylate cyclase/phosphodiesterase n=1 Tax=Thiocystis violacea TaxID=13725 RepID=UPI0019069695|nr:GGDEF and EAL domain-containing protein [Thiocystis violacea]MBK1716990.1 GGDEF domain-containing protein [Thiocystis violacea]
MSKKDKTGPESGVPVTTGLGSEPDLRQRAEARLAGQENPGMAAFMSEPTERLVHELRVHQIELELQNEELRRAHESLEASRARYFDLYDLAPVGYLTLGDADRIQEANLAAATLLGSSRDHLVDHPLTRFILPEDQDIYYNCRRELGSTGEPLSCELRLRRVEGHSIWGRLDISLALEERSDQPLWRVILIDITARKDGEQDLIDTRERLRRVAEIAELTFWEWDVSTNEVFFPPEWWRQTGYALGELPLRLGDWTALLHPEDRKRILDHLKHFVEAPGTPGEIQYRLRCKDGIYRWFVARLEAIRDARGVLARVLLVHQDVTRRKECEDQAVRLAQHDPLTGLPSRALLHQLADHMFASARRSGRQLAVLFVDLDKFKPINDLYGHQVGDQLLQAVARRLRDAFRAEDLVARVGGDEFVAVLANIRDGDDAARAAHTAIEALTPAHRIAGLELFSLPSIGISLFPRDGDSIDGLIQRADIAMYHAKQTCPGHYQFVTEELNQQARTTLTLESRLREGLKREEFRLVYQPVLDTKSGGVTGVEALLRWPLADGSEMAPLAFLPVAESSGLIHELGHWVFQEACRQHQTWRQNGLPPIRVAVNVSARQFHHQGFQQQLTAAARMAGVDPTALSLEVSEAALMQDPKASRQVLKELKQLGVLVALDDFGMGYYSLGELENLPLSRLEINRTLVQRLSVEGRMPAIVDAILCLGRALRLDITAVGIENEEDLESFRHRDCDQVQGFYLGVPMSGDHFTDWYREHSAVVQ